MNSKSTSAATVKEQYPILNTHWGFPKAKKDQVEASRLRRAQSPAYQQAAARAKLIKKTQQEKKFGTSCEAINPDFLKALREAEKPQIKNTKNSKVEEEDGFSINFEFSEADYVSSGSDYNHSEWN